MSLLHYKVHSTSLGDKGQVIAAVQYVTDALLILNRWRGRACIIKHQGRVVWNHAQDKDGWRSVNTNWVEKAQEIIKGRITEFHRAAYDTSHGPGAYDRMIAAMNLTHDIERENCAAAASVQG